MWNFVKKSLAQSNILNQALGDVVFGTSEIKGASSHSFFQWRIKRSVDGGQHFVALRMRPDTYAGAEGGPTNYMSFDIEAAKQLRADLDRCISECSRLHDGTSAQST
jgi:hypothetical protein